jgi:hypothetical protein
MQKSIQGLAQSLNSAPPSNGLEFSGGASGEAKHGKGGKKAVELGFMDSNADLRDAVADAPSDTKTKRGALQSRIADPKLESRERKACRDASCATDTSAGDQLKSLAASKAHTENYDIGGAGRAGSLERPSDYVRDNSLDPSTFTEQQKNAPGMHEALAQLGDLKAQRAHNDEELQKLTDERKHEKQPEKMAELNKKIDEAEKTHSAILNATSSAEEKVKKIKREVGTAVGAAPTPVPAKKKANTKG